MPPIPIEVSARHVHLTADDWRALFGAADMVPAHQLSQHPQFVAQQRVRLRGPKGEIPEVAIVGPARPYTQVELAMTDARRLGLRPPLSDSGALSQAATLTIVGDQGEVERPAAIVQQRHLHINPAEAAQSGLNDRQFITVRIGGPRGARLDQVLVRIHPSFSRQLHLDTDEGNACGVTPGMTAELVT